MSARIFGLRELVRALRRRGLVRGGGARREATRHRPPRETSFRLRKARTSPRSPKRAAFRFIEIAHA